MRFLSFVHCRVGEDQAKNEAHVVVHQRFHHPREHPQPAGADGAGARPVTTCSHLNASVNVKP